ncbi:hypothetical protein J1614_002021 [Plenodomus biglobosus]|nr:hypothetical protein J1614_002021 [Plenodomus biglobosus]
MSKAPNIFSFIVGGRKLLWYYYSQTVENHCQRSMSEFINWHIISKESLEKESLENYKETAKNTVTGQLSSDLETSQGVRISPNLSRDNGEVEGRVEAWW